MINAIYREWTNVLPYFTIQSLYDMNQTIAYINFIWKYLPLKIRFLSGLFGLNSSF